MDSTQLSFSTAYKSTLFCAILIWSINLLCFASYDEINLKSISIILLLFALSIIPMYIVIYLMILLTITPIYSYERNKLSKKEIFKKYFPYYAIVFFGICMFLGIRFSSLFIVNFMITVFLTAMQSWIWFFKKRDVK